MRKHIRIIIATVGLLTISLAQLLSARLSAGEDDSKAEKAIEALGGRVIRAPDAQGKPIISVDFTKTKVTDAGLTELAGLKNLQELNLHGTKVTDAGLKELAGLIRLQT